MTEHVRRATDTWIGYILKFWPIVVALVAMSGAQAVQTWRVASMDETVKADHAALQSHETKVAVIEANLQAMQRSIEESNRNTQRILDRMDRRGM